MTLRARDLFAGTGWGVACQKLGIHEDGWEIMREARATRAVHGMRTAGRDVREVLGHEGAYDIEIASPSCKRYSMAGNGVGRRALDAVLRGVQRYADGEPLTWPEAVRLIGDEDAALTLEPLRVALDSPARFLAWEQTPAVLPVWEACAELLAHRGWSVRTAILNAEQYGVPQTRRRAVLVARRDGKAARMPTPTHSRYHTRDPKRLDEGVKPWVSMAEALGWTGGQAQAVKSMGAGWSLRASAMTRAAVRTQDQPAPTITAGHDYNERVWVPWGERGIDGWPEVRPATTVLGDPRLGAPGHRDRSSDGERHHARSMKITIEQAALLQTYPRGFTFEGTKGKQFEQVGNAVPPLLAEAILATFL